MGPSALVHAAARRCTGLGRVLVQDAIFSHDAGGERVLELHVMAWDKGNALHALCTQLGVTTGETLAVGDAPSDLPMLEIAGIPVVMGQADPEMKRRGWSAAGGQPSPRGFVARRDVAPWRRSHAAGAPRTDAIGLPRAIKEHRNGDPDVSPRLLRGRIRDQSVDARRRPGRPRHGRAAV